MNKFNLKLDMNAPPRADKAADQDRAADQDQADQDHELNNPSFTTPFKKIIGN